MDRQITMSYINDVGVCGTVGRVEDRTHDLKVVGSSPAVANVFAWSAYCAMYMAGLIGNTL